MTMRLDRFRELLDAYGAEPRRWPEAERASAEQFMAENAVARALADEARGLDAWLDAGWSPETSELTVARVVRAAPSPRAILSRLGLASGVGWAAAAAAGLLVGLSLGEQVTRVWQADAALEQAAVWSADEAEFFG